MRRSISIHKYLFFMIKSLAFGQSFSKIGTAVSLLIVVFSCSEEKNTKADASFSSAGARQSQEVFEPSNFDKVDAEFLVVRNLSAVQKQVSQNKYEVSISFEPPRLTRYVEITVCSSQSGNCTKHRSMTNRINLNSLPNGKLSISAQACVDQQFAKSSDNCGPLEETTHVNPTVLNPELEQLYREKNNIENQIVDYVKKVQDHLEAYKSEMRQCNENSESQAKAIKMANFTGAVLKLGEAALSIGLKRYLADDKSVEFEKVNKDTTSTIDEQSKSIDFKEAMDTPLGIEKSEIQPTLKEFPSELELGSSFKDIYSAKEKLAGDIVPTSFAKNMVLSKLVNIGAKPVNAFTFVGGAVFSLFNASSLIIPRCLAEQRLKTTNAAAMTNIQSAVDSLKRLESVIEKLEGR